MGIPLDAAGQASRNGTTIPRSRSGAATTDGRNDGATPASPAPDLLAPPAAGSAPGSRTTETSSRVSASPLVGAERVPSAVFSSRTQVS
jgi:hypothetical protein